MLDHDNYIVELFRSNKAGRLHYAYDSIIQFKFIYLQFYRSRHKERVVRRPKHTRTYKYINNKRNSRARAFEENRTIGDMKYYISRTNFFPSPFVFFLFFLALRFRPRVILINSRGRDSQRGEFIKTACFYRRQPWDTQLCVQAGNSWTFVGALRYARARRSPVDL